MTEPEIINLGSISSSPKLSVSSLNEPGTIKLSNLPSLSSSPKKSVNFGPGAEMLMNTKKTSRSSSPKSDIKLSELKSLDINEKTMSKEAARGPLNTSSLFKKIPSSNLRTEGPIKLNINELTPCFNNYTLL